MLALKSYKESLHNSDILFPLQFTFSEALNNLPRAGEDH